MTDRRPRARRARLGDHRHARGTTPDPVNHFTFLSEAYVVSDTDFDGHVTVPVLWDTQARPHRQQRVERDHPHVRPRVRRASRSIRSARYCPDELRAEIDEINAFVYENVNDGVYRTGFARTQAAYERSFGRLFDALDELDARLATRRYLLGDTITEADWRLFTTLLRFDPVYVGHFKCNLRRIVDYPQLSGYLRDLYQQPGIAATVDMDHIKRHYYRTHRIAQPGSDRARSARRSTSPRPHGAGLDRDEHRPRRRRGGLAGRRRRDATGEPAVCIGRDDRVVRGAPGERLALAQPRGSRASARPCGSTSPGGRRARSEGAVARDARRARALRAWRGTYDGSARRPRRCGPVLAVSTTRQEMLLPGVRAD